MNLLPRVKILCPLSVFLEEMYDLRILSVHRKLSILERCPYGEVRLWLKRTSIKSNMNYSSYF